MRPSSFKKGGGFLDNVDVEWKDYQFTDEFNGEAFKAGKIKDRNGKQIDKPHSLNCLLTFRVDGADEDTTTTVKAASKFEDYEVSEDGHTITAAEGGECNISGKSGLGKFLQSLVEAGFPETNLDDDPDSINFEPALGGRYRLQQRTDAERTKEFGKKKGKDGKEYDRKDLIIAEVLALPEAEETKPAKGAKGKPASKGKPAKDEDEVDVEQLAKDTLVSILKAEKDKSILKTKLSVKVLTKLSKHENREDVRKLLGDDKFLSQEDADWTYSKTKGLIKLLDSDDE